MSENIIQTSFAGGELSPTLYARVDLAKYKIGAARMLNFFVDYRGGASNRPGTEFISRCLNSNENVRLISFQFSTLQNYILEFGANTMRVIKNGGHVLENAQTITAISLANPGVITTSVAHGFVTGDLIYFNVLGTTQLNQREYFATVLSPTTFSLYDWNGLPVNTSGYTAFTSGFATRFYKIYSPYAAADLFQLKFTQSADVLTICHPDYPPYDLSRFSDTAWVFTAVLIGSSILAPGAPTISVTGAAGTTNYAYEVTAINADGEESISSAANGQTNRINIAVTPGSVSITWPPVAGAVMYNVYKALPSDGTPIPSGALYGYMTSVTTNAASDTNIVPDFTVGPPTHHNPFLGNNPATVTYASQRKVYAGSDAQPETFWMSKPGQFKNFDMSSPVQPSDAITGTLVSRQVNQIKHMISMPGGLVMLTSGGAWQVAGAGGVVSPTTIQATPQAYNGAGDVPPLTINYEIIYIQQKGTIVRDLSYSFYTNIYTGSDLSVLSNHLFTGHTITDWTYAEEPFKIIWAVRSDGACLALTYLKDQEIFGWSRHETQGRFESVSSIPEGSEDSVYFVVQRYIGGQLIKFIERLHTRQMTYGPEDAFFVDCGISNESLEPVTTLTLAASTGTGILATVDVALFDSFWVTRVIRAGGGIMRVASYIDSMNVLVDIIQDVTDVDHFHSPTKVWPQKSGTWNVTIPFTIVTGLDHLEGETVAILADGNVITPQVVVNGRITLAQPATRVHVGLAYTSQLQTLYLDVGEPTQQGKRKNITAMTARVDQTRGLQMGQTFDDLVDFKDRDPLTFGLPIPLQTGDKRMILGGGWNTEGQMCLEQSNPLPATVLGVIPEITLGDTGK